MFLIRKLDRAGVLDGIDDPESDVALVTKVPLEIVRVGLPRLLQSGVFELRGDRLVMLNYIEAQTAVRTEKARQRASREQRRATARLGVTKRDKASRNVTKCHARSRAVTRGHAESRAVTNCHSVLCCADLISTEHSCAAPDPERARESKGQARAAEPEPISSEAPEPQPESESERAANDGHVPQPGACEQVPLPPEAAKAAGPPPKPPKPYLVPSGADTHPATWSNYPRGWRWSAETEVAASVAGVSVAQLQEHVDYWTTHVFSRSVCDLDGELRRSLGSIRTRAETASAKAAALARAIPRAGPMGRNSERGDVLAMMAEELAQQRAEEAERRSAGRGL
jgi:hypothetical protein